jgi:hypothetical protein
MRLMRARRVLNGTMFFGMDITNLRLRIAGMVLILRRCKVLCVSNKLCRKPGSAFLAAPGQHFAPEAGFHSFSKTMLALALEI